MILIFISSALALAFVLVWAMRRPVTTEDEQYWQANDYRRNGHVYEWDDDDE